MDNCRAYTRSFMPQGQGFLTDADAPIAKRPRKEESPYSAQEIRDPLHGSHLNVPSLHGEAAALRPDSRPDSRFRPEIDVSHEVWPQSGHGAFDQALARGDRHLCGPSDPVSFPPGVELVEHGLPYGFIGDVSRPDAWPSSTELYRPQPPIPEPLTPSIPNHTPSPIDNLRADGAWTPDHTHVYYHQDRIRPSFSSLTPDTATTPSSSSSIHRAPNYPFPAGPFPDQRAHISESYSQPYSQPSWPPATAGNWAAGHNSHIEAPHFAALQPPDPSYRLINPSIPYTLQHESFLGASFPSSMSDSNMTTASPGPEPHGGQIWGGIAENREAGPWIKHEFSDTPDPERILASVPTVEPQDRKYKIVAESSDNPEPIIEKQRARIVKHPKSRVTLEGKNSPAIKKEFSDGPSHDNETLPANKPLDDFRQNLTRNTGGPGDSQLQVGGSLATDTANPSADNSCGGNKRRSYQDELRRDTFDARLQGACVRCHQQRIRCVPNPDDIGLPCSTCLAVKRNSKKTIHDIVCIRFRLRLLDLFRHGGIHVTERFLYTDMKNVDIQTGSHITISMSQGLCKKPMKLRLQEFIPNEGDILYRKYIDNGVWKKHHTQPFWLSDITQTAMEFEVYIKENALDGLLEVSKDSDWIVKETFTMIHRLCSHPDEIIAKDEQSRNAQHAFLLQTVHLWFTMRHGTGSAWIAGEEKLGILPMPETSSTVVLRGKTPIPRMLVAQFDCIRHGHLLKAMAPKFLRIYEALASESSSDSWFTVYLATFLIIHEVSWASSDRLRYARENSDGLLQETRYGPIDSPLTEYVERIQHDGAMFLGHWRYFKRLNAWDADWDNPDKTILEQLRPGQLKFMKATVEYLKKRMGTFPETPSAGCWENELFWVSRLLTPVPPEDDLWTPPVIFDRTRPEVGREH